VDADGSSGCVRHSWFGISAVERSLDCERVHYGRNLPPGFEPIVGGPRHQNGPAVLIHKGSHQAIRMLLKSPRDQAEENYLVVTVQHEGKLVLAGLREAYWRQWEGHYIPELRVTIRKMKEKPHPPPPKRP
jgi:hypothetical protein